MPTKSNAPIIAGNWKMYKTLPEALSFIEGIESVMKETNSEIWLAVPFTLIRDTAKKAEGTRLIIGAQNMNDATEGAFTGEVSGRMLRDAGAKFVVLGHSERRNYFKETNELINKKVKKALKEGLKVLLCVGESFEDHENGHIELALETQIIGSLEGLEASDFVNVTLAYEPIWAIGSGKPASPTDVEQENQAIRAIVSGKWGNHVGEQLKILYGGSVNPENAESFFEEKNINGIFVGTASLNSDSFAKIIALTPKSS